MPRVTVPDKAPGDVFTEAMWDTYIRDNFNIGSHTPIADTILGSAAANIDFTSLPQTFAHLHVVGHWRAASGTIKELQVRLNNDSTAIYHYVMLTSNGSSFTGVEAASQTAWRVSIGSGAAGEFSSFELLIPQYSVAHRHSYCCRDGGFNSGSAANCGVFGGRYTNGSPAAVSRLTFIEASATNIDTASRITVYGVPYI